MEKSSFLKRTMSNEDAIIQVLRPMWSTKVNQSLDIFERLVNECESLTKQGITITAQQRFVLTAKELKDNLDEFGELEKIATMGRELLDKLGYVSRRQNTPMVGVAPNQKTVDVQPITTQLPGQEPLEGVVIQPKGKK